MKKLFWVLFVLTILSSCTTQKRCAKRFPQVASIDSIYIEKVKEIPVYIPGDSIEIEIPIDCPDQDLAVVETGRLKQIISILNKKLTSTTTIKPDTVIVTVTEIKEKIVIEKKPVEIRYVPRWVKFLSWAGGIAIIILALLIGLKIAKIKSSIFKLFKR